jgi:hypothetical protein
MPSGVLCTASFEHPMDIDIEPGLCNAKQKSLSSGSLMTNTSSRKTTPIDSRSIRTSADSIRTSVDFGERIALESSSCYLPYVPPERLDLSEPSYRMSTISAADG